MIPHLLLVHLLPFLASAVPPWYDDRANLLFYLDRGERRPVRTPRDWEIRAGHVRANMELVMGELPAKSTEPLAVEVKNESKLRHYTRRHIWFTAEKGDRVPAYLLIPHQREGKLPAMVCLPQTVRIGKDEPAGLGINASLAYAHELAERGFVCIVVDYPLVHAVEYKTDPYKLGYASATMKGIVNHRRAVDVLESLPFVDRQNIGVIGHSLGGHNALFLAAFEPRIRAIVSSCGFNVFAKHAKGDVRAWSSRSYMPRIREIYKDDPKKIPFDFTEVLAILAPRAVFVNAPLHDAPDFEVSGVRDCVDAALPVYRKVFDSGDRLVVQHPDAGHSFPLEQRLAAYHFLDQHLRPTVKGPDIAAGLVHHWPLRGSLDNLINREGRLSGDHIDLKASGRDGKPNSAAAFDGRLSGLVGPSLDLGKADFSFACWLHTARDHETCADLFGLHDAEHRRGLHLTLKSPSGVTTCQPASRQLKFGIDDAQVSSFTDCGRPGNAVLAFGLAVHEGHLYAATSESGKDEAGRVWRYLGGQGWIDCGLPSRSNAVSALAVHDGRLYAGTARYRFAGSALEESNNLTLGGRVWRYEGGTRWTDCGQLPGVEAIGGLVSWRGKLHASSLYKPAGFFRYEGGTRWTDAGTPDGKRVEALTVFRDDLCASSYDGGHVYRHDGKKWTDLGRLGDNTQTYSFAVFEDRLHVGTWPSGRVYRLDGEKWTDCGRLGEEKEVMGMMVHNGSLYAGTLPLAEVYRFDTLEKWTKVGRIDQTPEVKYRRAWTMAEFQGQLMVSALPSGKVFAFEAGRSVTWDHELPAGWHHLAAIRQGGVLKLYVDGRFAARSTSFDPARFDLTSKAVLHIGFGQNDRFRGRLSDVRIYRRALAPSEIAELAK